MPTTPNMNLTLPVVSQTPGPTWANQINADLSVIDSHNHIPDINGGVAITTAALDIDADVSFNQFSAIGLNTARFVNRASIPSAGSLYITNGDLWYSYDGALAARITDGGNIAGSPGSISGLVSPAAVIYDAPSGTFSFYSDQTPPAQIGILAARQMILRSSSSASPITIATSPSATSYTMTLPTAVPGSAGIVGFATNGVLSAVVPDSTISVSSSAIGVASLGITSAQIASNAVQTTKINDKAVTQIKLENKSASGATASGTNVGPSSTVEFASFTCSLVSGRPILITLDSLQNTSASPAPVPAASSLICAGNPELYISVIHPDGTTETQMGHVILGSGYNTLSSAQAIFNVVSTGTHTIKLKSYCDLLTDTVVLANGFLKAFQL